MPIFMLLSTSDSLHFESSFREGVSADNRSRTDADEIVEWARDTFRCFHNWLTDTSYLRTFTSALGG
jgi:hypothetical protein